MSKHRNNGWIKVTIEDILEKQDSGVTLGQGWSPQCLKTPSPSEEIWGVLKTTAVQAGYFIEKENKQLPETLQPRPQHEVKPGDLLITCAGPRNRCGVACLVRKSRKRLMISGKMYRFRISREHAIPEFIEAYLQSQEAQKAIDKMKTGGSESGLNLTHARFKKLTIPLPAVSEQLRIVCKIEELFSALDKSIEDLKMAQQQLKVYRQSVLKWAFEGRLTNEEVKEGALPNGWKQENLNDVVDKVFDGPFGSHLKSNDYVSHGVRIIRLENIGHLKFNNEYETYVTEEKYNSISKHTVSTGDIIFSSFISDELRVVILPEFINKAVNKADCFCIRVAESNINRKYLAYYLSTRAVYSQLEGQVHGATRPRINTKQLKNVVIPVSPLTEQNNIVEEIDSRMSVADKVEETIMNSLGQADALRQSILKKAFEGKLV